MQKVSSAYLSVTCFSRGDDVTAAGPWRCSAPLLQCELVTVDPWRWGCWSVTAQGAVKLGPRYSTPHQYCSTEPHYPGTRQFRPEHRLQTLWTTDKRKTQTQGKIFMKLKHVWNRTFWSVSFALIQRGGGCLLRPATWTWRSHYKCHIAPCGNFIFKFKFFPFDFASQTSKGIIALWMCWWDHWYLVESVSDPLDSVRTSLQHLARKLTLYLTMGILCRPLWRHWEGILREIVPPQWWREQWMPLVHTYSMRWWKLSLTWTRRLHCLPHAIFFQFFVNWKL